MRLVFVGEAMVELAPEGGLYRRGFAGDTFNMAWYAQKCAPHWQTDFVTAIGTDTISIEFASYVKDSGIGAQYMRSISDRSLGLYMISLKNGERSFSYWRSHSAARLLAQDPKTLHHSFAGADLITISGITLAILDDQGRDTLFTALVIAKSAGSRIAFDPNIRPRLWASADQLRTTISRFAGLSDIILASFDDEATHFGDKTAQDTLQRYHDAKTVVIKDGAAQMLARHAGQHFAHSPPRVKTVVDSTAAGDSFNAAFLTTWLAGHSMGQALAAGAELAAKVIQYRGALAAEALE